MGIGIVTVFFGWQVPGLGFEYDLEKFFPEGHEETAFFERFRDTFGNDDDYIWVGIGREEGIFDSVFLARVDSLARQIGQLPQVAWMLSPTQAPRFARHPMSARPRRLPGLHLDQPQRYPQDSAWIYEASPWGGFLFGEDRQSVLIYLKNTERLHADGCAALTDSLDALLARFPFDEVHLAGRCEGQTRYTRMLQREVRVFIGATVALILLVLALTYRALWGVLVPMAVVGLSVVWTAGLMALLGKPIDMIANIIPTVLLVIGLADAVHLLTYFLRLRQAGESQEAALRAAVEKVGPATVLTTLTTALGFLTLMTSSFQPLVDLGLFTTLGILIALGLTYTVIPACIRLWPPDTLIDRLRHAPWQQVLSRVYTRIPKHASLIMALWAAIGLLGVAGALLLTVNNYVLEDLRDDHPLRKDFEFFANRFGGVRSFELEVSVREPNARIWDLKVLDEIWALEAYLHTHYGVSNLISPANLIARANQVYHQGNLRYYGLPRDSALITDLVFALEGGWQESLPERVYADDGRTARITGKIPDWGSRMIAGKNQELRRYMDQHLKTIEGRITGTAHLMDLNHRYMVRDVLLGLAIAVVLIGGLFATLLGSFRVLFISLIVNLIPLLGMAGIMGFCQVDLKISTSIIFIIAFGIAVDDSIHFLSRLRIEMQHYHMEEAVRRTFLSTGKAILLTSLILCGGFLVLCLSDFLGIFYLGLLLSGTLLLALGADLLLLPVLLLKYMSRSPE